MNSADRILQNSFRILDEIYKISGGSQRMLINVWDVGYKIGLDRQTTRLAVDYLIAKGLLRFVALGGMVSLTQIGLKSYVEATQNPSIGSENFPPVNIINVNKMEGSQIQQGTVGSRQTLYFTQPEIDTLRNLLPEMKNVLQYVALIDQKEIEGYIMMLDGQLRVSKINTSFISETITTLQAILQRSSHIPEVKIIIDKLDQLRQR